jgi:PAS domain S-box-containing protein
MADNAFLYEESLFRELINNLPGCYIFLKDEKSRFILTSMYHLKILGKKRLDEVVGKTDFDFFPKELASKYYDDEQSVIRTGVPLIDREERVIDAGGHESWVITTKIPVRNKKGVISGIVGLCRDITEMKQLMLKHQQAIAELQSALHNIKVLHGLIPMCSSCKKIRDDKGFWQRVEAYLENHSDAQFTHGLCPDCVSKLYPDYKVGDQLPEEKHPDIQNTDQ